MNANENVQKCFWIGKKAKVEILKDDKRLIYTATILELDNSFITFKDRDENVFSFNIKLVKQMQQLNGGV